MTIKIEGMACGMCEAAVKRALEAVPGVKNACPSRLEKSAVLELEEGVEPSPAVLEQAVKKAGFNFMGIA